MKRRILTVVTGIIFLILMACSGDPWVDVRLDGTDIFASFPQEPSQESKSMELPGFGDVTMTMARYTDKGISYTVSVMKIADTDISFNEENMAPHAMLRKGASLGDTIDVYLGSLSGKEYQMNFKGRTVIQRMFVDDNKMYTIVTMFESDKSGDADKFLASIKL